MKSLEQIQNDFLTALNDIELTEDERKTIHWLSNCEWRTLINLTSIIKKLRSKKGASKGKKDLATNPVLNQFVPQDFPVIEKSFDHITFKSVKVIEYLSSHKTFECTSFFVEVVKDFDGFVSYILHGRSKEDKDVWIMRIDDFNKAYELKNRLNELLDNKPSERMLMPCYGSLQREKLEYD